MEEKTTLRASMNVSSRSLGQVLQILLAAGLALVTMACGDYTGEDADNSVLANSVGTAVPQGLSIADQVTTFEATVYPMLRQYCEECHSGSGPGTPAIAHSNSSVAWSAVVDNQKVNFATPTSSRIVRRLSADRHYCWSDCTTDASEMLNEVLNWQAAILALGGNTSGVDVDGLNSDTKTLADGTIDQGSDRYEQNMIARWDFTEGIGALTALDSSGVAPAMDLDLQGPQMMSSYGIDIQTGQAIAMPGTSRKLYDQIANINTGSQEYSVEMWVSPENTTQEERILGYGGNFSFFQIGYQYSYRNRAMAQGISGGGTPSLITYDVDQDAQATLQHVVITYDQVRGRRIYVDGVFTDDDDQMDAGRLWTWDENSTFRIGGNAWVGNVRFAAIFRQLLSDAQIRQNFLAGVGRRITLAFDISQWTGGNSSIQFSVTELDDYSYLFCQPTLSTDTGQVIQVQGMNVALNGSIPAAGQGFKAMDVLVTAPNQQLSAGCTVLGGKVDPATDSFQLVFEGLGIFQDPIPDPPPTPIVDVFGPAPPVIGIRDFGRVNATMSWLTGVDKLYGTIPATYAGIEQQLPGTTDILSFVAAQQVGIAKLAIEYCDALVEDTRFRDPFFWDGTPPAAASDPFTMAPAAAFGTPGNVDAFTDPILDKILGTGLRGDISGTPARDVVETRLDQLITDLQVPCGSMTCTDADTRNIVKGVCTAVLSSAPVSLH